MKIYGFMNKYSVERVGGQLAVSRTRGECDGRCILGRVGFVFAFVLWELWEV